MLAERASYVIFYQGDEFIKEIEKLPFDVSFISKKSSYVVIYADKKEEENIKKQLKKLKGFKGFSESQLYDQERNF